MIVDYGYNLDYIPSIDASAYTITVNGETVAASSAVMAIIDETIFEPKLFLTLESSIPEDAEVTVDYNGTEELYYSSYSPVTDDYLAAAFTGEVAVYDPNFEFVSIKENAKVAQFHMFPNPVVNELTIESPEAISDITIFDITGKMVYQVQSVLGTNATVDVSELTTGIYMVQVVDNEGIASARKLIK